MNALGAQAPILVACALTFVLYLGAYMRLPLVPLLASDLGATNFQVGMINAGFMLAAASLSIPLGLVSDRLGRRRLILAGMIVSGLTSIFLVLARTPVQVGSIYLFSGIGLACFSPSMMSYVGDVSPPSFLGRAYGWYTAALYLGMAAGPGLGGVVASGGFRTAFLVSAAVIAAGIVLGAPRLPAPPPVAHAPSVPVLAALGELLRNRTVLACWIATLCATFAWGALFAFFPLYARSRGISVAHTGFIFTCQAASNALLRIPVGHLADRTGGRGRYIVSGCLLFGVGIASVGFLGSPGPLYALFAAIGGTMAAAFIGIGALLAESVPTRTRGLAMGGYNSAIYGGFALSAATLGAVIDRFGFRAGYAAAGSVCALAALAFPFLAGPGPRKN